MSVLTRSKTWGEPEEKEAEARSEQMRPPGDDSNRNSFRRPRANGISEHKQNDVKSDVNMSLKEGVFAKTMRESDFAMLRVKEPS